MALIHLAAVCAVVWWFGWIGRWIEQIGRLGKELGHFAPRWKLETLAPQPQGDPDAPPFRVP
jgi:hypothetical protein